MHALASDFAAQKAPILRACQSTQTAASNAENPGNLGAKPESVTAIPSRRSVGFLSGLRPHAAASAIGMGNPGGFSSERICISAKDWRIAAIFRAAGRNNHAQ